MKAAITMIEETATSSKVFDLVFQPMSCGYLDVEEIERKSKVEQQILGLLADGLKLADKMKAESVVSLIQDELQAQFDGPGSVSLNVVRKLFEARPMTDGFLARFLSHPDSLFRDAKLLQAARERVAGFIEFEQTHLSEPVSEETPSPAKTVNGQVAAQGEISQPAEKLLTAEAIAGTTGNDYGEGTLHRDKELELQSEDGIKQRKRSAQDCSPTSATDLPSSEAAIDTNDTSTSAATQPREQTSQVGITDLPQTPPAPITPQPHGHQEQSPSPAAFYTPEAPKQAAMDFKEIPQRRIQPARETRGRERKVAFNDRPTIHPISSPVDVPDLPRPPIIDLNEGGPSRRLRQRTSTPSTEAPQLQKPKNGKSTAAKVSAETGKKKVQATGTTKAGDTARTRAQTASKNPALGATAKPKPKAAAKMKAPAKGPKTKKAGN